MDTTSNISTSTEKSSENELIQKILSGEKHLYEILIRKNNLKLHRVIRGYLKNRQEVEDAMQNTYVKAYEKLFQFNGTSQFSTWLIRIGINEALKTLKEKEKEAHLFWHEDTDHKKQAFQFSDPYDLNPEKQTIFDEVKTKLETAIDKLPQKYRTVYIFHEIEKMPVTEIKKVTGLSNVNIRVRLHRAKLILKDELNGVSTDGLFDFGLERCDFLVEKVLKTIH